MDFDCRAAETPEAEYVEATGEILYEDYFQDNWIPSGANSMRVVAACGTEGGMNHPGGTNVLYRDGHVDFLLVDEETGGVPNPHVAGVDSDIYTLQDPLQPRDLNDAALVWEP